MKALVVTAMIGGVLIMFSAPCFSQPADCYYCFTEDGHSWACNQGPQGWFTCIGGSTCTHGPDACGYGSGGGCFLAGETVATPQGPVPVEFIAVGDEVLTYSEEGNVSSRSEVVETYRLIRVGYYVINGSLKVTGTHPFRVGDRWVTVSHLKVGDELVGLNGETIPIVSIEQENSGVRVYNLQVKGDHTFFVDGYLVHNKGPDPNG